jgi:DNA polymerase-1
MEKLLLIDSYSLLHRAFYAIPALQNRNGQFTNAVYGYLSMLAKLIADVKPAYIAAAFDVKGKTARHCMYDQYKATRKCMPDELASQVPILKSILTAMGIRIVEKEGLEADDIIGTLSKRCAGVQSIIVTGDRDCLQLIDDNTLVYRTMRGVSDIKIYDAKMLAAEGFTPAQIIEYKGLAGDNSDNIPGASGVGDKTAQNLLAEYGDIEGIYQNIDKIKGKLKENLIASKATVYLSKLLATIETRGDFVCNLQDLAVGAAFPAKAKELFLEYEIKSLIPRFKFDEQTAPAAPASKIIEISDIEQLNAIASKAKQGPLIVFDFGQDGVKFSTEAGRVYEVKFTYSLIDAGLSPDETYRALSPLFQSDMQKVVFDAKAAMRLLKDYGITLCAPYDDVLLMSYLVNCTNTPANFAALLNTYQSELFSVYGELKARLTEKNLLPLYLDIELPMIPVLFDMENAGFCIDTGVLDALSRKFKVEIAEEEEKIYLAAGCRFNINSTGQLGEIMEKLGVNLTKKNKRGYSVSAEILAEIEHPIAAQILKYRQKAKLLSTYIEGIRPLIGKDGRVHTIFKQCLTLTGRLSSIEPNLQNIPIKTAEGREIRKIFIASAGNVLIAADYSQIELRLLAHLSGDETLISAFQRGDDIHALTASKVCGVRLADVTPDMRNSAKAVNFGIIYGMSAFGLASQLGISNGEAKNFIDRYFANYPKVKDFMQNNVCIAKAQGYIATLAGRIRSFPELATGSYLQRGFAERAAMNMPLQGGAADIIKIAMLRVAKALADKRLAAKLILQVHDELIIDAPREEAEYVAALVKSEMEGAYALSVPLTANVQISENWYSK